MFRGGEKEFERNNAFKLLLKTIWLGPSSQIPIGGVIKISMFLIPSLLILYNYYKYSLSDLCSRVGEKSFREKYEFHLLYPTIISLLGGGSYKL